MKTTKRIYWTATVILFLLEGLMPALTSHTQLAVEGIRHLGYPDYFRVMLTIFKVAGALALVLPFVKGNVKEWAYAGFGFTLISACVSHWAVDGFTGQTIFPLVVFAILVVSYKSYHKLVAFAKQDASTQGMESNTAQPNELIVSGASR
ncbi:DoxX family protein [Xanthocytophaga agilis]|uniref:DoxX family protein n=1 Tax=Xanthocytophaga agilis TaxID=3048010 RepID=A0AAE3RB78_9BACT|nr:DoxX family protein [Xanthocytophaga agilis]MDJ1504784.1 DoxX family protein [Xanthocytophaga agilis]